MASPPQQLPPPPQWQPSHYRAPVTAEISRLELASAQSKVLWAGMLVAGVGGLSLAAYLTWGLLIPGGYFLISLLPLDWTKLPYQGVVYLVLAVLIWRRSMIALAVATLLFVADSAIYTYGKFPLMSGLSLSLLGYWPWGIIVPIVLRAAVLWRLVTTFKSVALMGLDRKQRKAAA